MPRVDGAYTATDDLVLGRKLNDRVPEADQKRQRREVDEILRRLRTQPGVVLADEVGMGKTFVALAVACSIAMRRPSGPVIVMVPANLVEKWVQDLSTFCELYLANRRPLERDGASRKEFRAPSTLRYGVARHSVELMKLLDDPRGERCHLVFLAQGAMARRQTDKWVRLALIAEALRRHGRGRAARLIKVKTRIHLFLAELLWAVGEERACDRGGSLWSTLIRSDPRRWKDIYNDSVQDERRKLNDDPVPRAVEHALHRVDLSPLAAALEQMPIQARGGSERVSTRLDDVRRALRKVEEQLWVRLLAESRWRSPLLVMDEAHHLKNPATALVRQLQSHDSEQLLRTGDGAMANSFERMLFLTATPFQLGHRELVHVLRRFGDVRWSAHDLGPKPDFNRRLDDLGHNLDGSQRAVIALQRAWSRLHPEDCDGDVECWWNAMCRSGRDELNLRQRAVMDAYRAARHARNASQKALAPWIVRHNKGQYWGTTQIPRRQRQHGAGIIGHDRDEGLPVPPDQLLPFFLAARSAIQPGKDLLGEALCSSYEAFRDTRRNRTAAKDEADEQESVSADLSHASWYLDEFDHALKRCSGAIHPKVSPTVRKVVDLWEKGEKVLVFAFYRHTCRALRIHISNEIEKRLLSIAQDRLRAAGQASDSTSVSRLLERIQRRYFDDPGSPGRRAVDNALNEIMASHGPLLAKAEMIDQRKTLENVMRRFMRVTTTLVRCFPIAELEHIAPADAVARLLSHVDATGVSWRRKLDTFIEHLATQCSAEERRATIEAALGTQTGGIRVEAEEHDDNDDMSTITLANVQVATGDTKRGKRARLMRAFNTPFFPDILICSEVMGEGVDLQRYCRHVIHHDLAWNPSTIEQRTGRVDRLGCKAEHRQPIVVCLPYLAGAADERQYRVMSDREQWFRVVMGQDEVAGLITAESDNSVPLPRAVADELSFDLGL